MVVVAAMQMIMVMVMAMQMVQRELPERCPWMNTRPGCPGAAAWPSGAAAWPTPLF